MRRSANTIYPAAAWSRSAIFWHRHSSSTQPTVPTASHRHHRAVMVPWRKALRDRKDKPIGALDSMAFKKAKMKASLIRPW